MDVPWRLIRSLSTKKEREATGLTVAEGLSSVISALSAQVEVEWVVLSSSFAGSERARMVHDVLASYPREVTVFEVEDGLFSRMADTETPQGVLCVLPFPFRFLGPQPRSAWASPLYLVGLDIQDPGNVGTLVRTAAAAGCNGIVLSGQAADPYSPKAIRASAGAIFQVNLGVENDPLRAVSSIMEKVRHLYMTSPREGSRPWDVDFAGPCAIVVGNEARGIREEVLAIGGTRVTIPMPGQTESLNVGMASAMLLYEAMRQRLAAGERWGK